MIEQIVSIIFYGISLGCILALLSIGFSLILGFMRVLNFAYGFVYALGAYLIFYFVNIYRYNYWLSVVLIFICGAAFGISLERSVICRLYGKDMSFALLITYGVVLVLTGVLKLLAGINPKPVPDPFGITFTLPFIGVNLSLYRLVTILVALPLYAIVWFIFTKTMIGKIVMAGVEDLEGILSIGISPIKAFILTFIIGCGLAAVAGVFHAPMVLVQPYMSIEIILYAIAVVTIGGMANLKGTLFASLLVGQVITVSSFLYAPSGSVVAFILLLIFVAIKAE